MIKKVRIGNGKENKYYYNVNLEYFERFKRIYYNMKYRTNPKAKSQAPRIKCYRDKGITTCNAWLDFHNFFLDMYESYCDHVKLYGDKNTTLDRIDNYLGYSKYNCRWATLKEQAQNKEYPLADLRVLYRLSNEKEKDEIRDFIYKKVIHLRKFKEKLIKMGVDTF